MSAATAIILAAIIAGIAYVRGLRSNPDARRTNTSFSSFHREQNMQLDEPVLKLSGYSSGSRLEEIFASYMVDVAYLAEVFDDYALVVPDEPERIYLNIEADREWLIGIIKEAMKVAGEHHVQVTFLPAAP